MRDLAITFEDPFQARELTIDRKIAFGDDALARFAKQNNGGMYAEVIAAMTSAQALLSGKTVGVMTDESIRQSLTDDVDEAMHAFTARVTKLNRIMVAEGINKQSVYQQFFPQGVGEFTTNITKENIEQRMEFLITAITNNLASAGGPTVLDEFTDIQSTYLNKRDSQLGKKGDTDTTRDQRNTAEDTWNDAFFDALLAAARKNRNHPERLNLFFDQTILRTPKNPANDGKGRLAGTVTFVGGAPVQGADVHIVDGKINNAHTNATGKYATQYLAIGNYAVTISLDGTVVYTGTINIKDDGDTELDVEIPVG